MAAPAFAASIAADAISRGVIGIFSLREAAAPRPGDRAGDEDLPIHVVLRTPATSVHSNDS